MMRLAREFRLLPVVLFAAICLFTLKIIGIARDGGYTLAEPSETSSMARTAAAEKNLPVSVGAKQSWAQEMFNYPDAAAIASENSGSSQGPG